MQFTTIAAAALSLLATTASAAALAPRQAQAPEPVTADTVFKLLSLRSASDVHFRYVSAANNSLFLKLANQGASCDRQSDNEAQFRLVDGNLYLYRRSATPQQIWVDRSGMGQGITGYTTGAQPVPSRNGERGPFVVGENNILTLNGSAGFLACPGSEGGAYSIWTAAGVTSPAGIEGCLGISLRVAPVSEPNSCLYTDRPAA